MIMMQGVETGRGPAYFFMNNDKYFLFNPNIRSMRLSGQLVQEEFANGFIRACSRSEDIMKQHPDGYVHAEDESVLKDLAVTAHLSGPFISGHLSYA